MKKFFVFISCVLCLTSCSVLRKSTATTMDVNASLSSKNKADLVVSNNKISYTYTPNKQDRKAGMKHVIDNAVAAALKANDNADVLVQKQHEVVYKVYMFGRKKIRTVTVTGYPATFANFKSIEK